MHVEGEMLGFADSAQPTCCVQLMGLSNVSSPYPVLWFGTGATLLFAVLYGRGWKSPA